MGTLQYFRRQAPGAVPHSAAVSVAVTARMPSREMERSAASRKGPGKPKGSTSTYPAGLSRRNRDASSLCTVTRASVMPFSTRFFFIASAAAGLPSFIRREVMLSGNSFQSRMPLMPLASKGSEILIGVLMRFSPMSAFSTSTLMSLLCSIAGL